MSQWFTDYRMLPASSSVVCLGNFDGLHKGHQTLLLDAKKEAKRRRISSIIFTFSPHPSKILRPEAGPEMILNAEEKRALFDQLNFDFVLNQNFDVEFSRIEAEDFVQKILVDQLGAQVVCTGANFRFGHRAMGSVETIKKFSSLQLLDHRLENSMGSVISSSRIRACIAKAEMCEANELLGYPYFITGRVKRGQALGSKLGFPTANVHFEKECVPPYGVYSVAGVYRSEMFTRSPKLYRGTANFGVRPTVEKTTTPHLEVYFHERMPDLYDQELCIFFWRHIRPEKKFSNLEELKARIAVDVERSRQDLLDFPLEPLEFLQAFSLSD